MALLSGSTLQEFLWGLDLSGNEYGAGGVGGLLKITHVGSYRPELYQRKCSDLFEHIYESYLGENTSIYE